VGSLHGKPILVTGAARGIGAESARALAAAGARVSLVGLEPERLEQAAAACGPEALWFDADVTDAEAVERAVGETVERFGSLYGLVANAGIAGFGSVRTIDPAAFERTIEVNVIGTWRTVRAALEPIIAARGYILNVASLAAITAPPGMSGYGASKAGIEAFSDALRWEVAGLGVDVGVAYFSWLDTDLVTASEVHPGFATLRSGLPGPLGKTHSVQDAAQAIVRGIERRSERVYAPRWLRGLMAVRGGLNALSRRDMRKVGAEVAEQADRYVAERGSRDASIPQHEGSRAGFGEAADR